MRPGWWSRRCAVTKAAVEHHGAVSRVSAAALRHGVAGVDREVHDHLLELSRVGRHAPRGGSQPQLQVDVLADQAAQHRVEVADERVEVEHLRLEHLPAAEGQELAREAGGALRRRGWICSSVVRCSGVARLSRSTDQIACSR